MYKVKKSKLIHKKYGELKSATLDSNVPLKCIFDNLNTGFISHQGPEEWTLTLELEKATLSYLTCNLKQTVYSEILKDFKKFVFDNLPSCLFKMRDFGLAEPDMIIKGHKFKLSSINAKVY